MYLISLNAVIHKFNRSHSGLKRNEILIKVPEK